MADIGVIGLGVMGSNIALNMADCGFKVHVFNRTSEKTKELEGESENIKGFFNMEDFVNSLSKPRKILLMVTAGEVIDELLEHFKPLLDNDDIVIDGGNSHYGDSIRRYKICKFNFVGCGISGGAYGARNGPAMFFGCKKEVYDNIKEIFEKSSAKHDNKPCCGRMGNDGAGHFVKMVHNGI
ncbi:6-phosphogluconate dehydrogenase, decarboxylating-like, partial [Arctopsyche grandis]|uniref:6-phosphogluconate dehydrogenase, decarboxylating-like n=1 Tax=Arctopsyche grandis TaxID=121162 RepID=UPI00406D9EC4